MIEESEISYLTTLPDHLTQGATFSFATGIYYVGENLASLETIGTLAYVDAVSNRQTSLRPLKIY